MSRDAVISTGIELSTKGVEQAKAQLTGLGAVSDKVAGEYLQMQQRIEKTTRATDASELAQKAAKEQASRLGAALSGLGGIAGRLPGPVGDAANGALALAGAASTARAASLALGGGLGVARTAVLGLGTAIKGLVLTPVGLAFLTIAGAVAVATSAYERHAAATAKLAAAEKVRRDQADADDALQLTRDQLLLSTVGNLGRLRQEQALVVAAEHAGAAEGKAWTGTLAEGRAAVEKLDERAKALTRSIHDNEAQLAILRAGGNQFHAQTMTLNGAIDQEKAALARVQAQGAALAPKITELTAAQEKATQADKDATATRQEAAEALWSEFEANKKLAAGIEHTIAVQELYNKARLQTMQADEANAGIESATDRLARLRGEMRDAATGAMALGGAFGSAFGVIADKSMSAEQRVKAVAQESARAVLGAVRTVILAKIAEAAAKEFSANAGLLPGIGLLLAGGAVAATFAFGESLISRLPTAHQGAIVPGPASQERLMMVRGQEAVIPLDTPRGRQALGSGGGGLTIIIHQSVPTSAAEAARAARAGILPALRRAGFAGA